MDIFTHFMLGGLLFVSFLKDLTFEFFFLAVFCAVLPDLDIFISPLKRINDSKYLEHRGGSHSYVIGAILSLPIGGIFSLLTHQPFVLAWLVGSLFYALHVSMDLLTTTTIPFLFPLSKKEVSFYIEKAGSFFTMLNSLVFLILLLIFYLNSVEFFAYIILVNIYTYFFLGYYGIRIFSKLWLNFRMDDNQKILPGVLPAVFTIFNCKIDDCEVSSSIERKSVFRKGRIIANNSILLRKNEMDWFKNGIEWCNKSYYFAKWTKYPKFTKNQNSFIINLFFLETMMRGAATYVQFNYDTINQKLVSVKRGYGRI